MWRRGVALVWVVACGGPVQTESTSGNSTPFVRAELPVPEAAEAVKSPLAAPLRSGVEAARLRLLQVVKTHAADPTLPWAMGHALLVLGPELRLPSGELAIDTLFSSWARLDESTGVPLLSFPKKVNGALVEPHTDLMLKVLADIGVSPDRPVVVQGRSVSVAALYQGSLSRTWLAEDEQSFTSWNDAPWTLHGVSLWSPAHASWSALDGHRTQVSALSHAVVMKLQEETAFLRETQRTGAPLEKRGQGIFSYTCGGAHLLQGAATSVAAGFATEGDVEVLKQQAGLVQWRFDAELAVVDAALRDHPEYTLILLVQRLKFAGHTLESMHRLAALGFLDDDPEVRASLARVEDALVHTVDQLDALGVLADPHSVRAQREQTFLDLLGDSAHAVHGLDLASGAASVYK